ncbi:MAG: hypothetical protein Q7U47_01285 [Paludibacter sp.]|nr:hypothetical protein [Paludibacter sp.]
MSKYKTTTDSMVVTGNKRVNSKNYTSIELTNIGLDDATVNGNIPLPAGASYSWANDPDVVIDSDTDIIFAGVAANKKVLVQMFYFNTDKQ